MPLPYNHTLAKKKLEKIRAFRDAAVADGWVIEPLYKVESVENAAKLTTGKWVMHVYTRAHTESSMRIDTSISIWGPDQLQVEPPDVYDMDEIKRRLRRCNYCTCDNLDVQRVGFAGRCCRECLPAMRKKYEFPGWTN